MLLRMQKSMDGLQTKYGGEIYMADEERNKKYAAKFSEECDLDVIAMFRFEAFTAVVVRVRKDKLRNHVDVQNDWRRGYNITSVWSFILEDDDGNIVRISFISYT